MLYELKNYGIRRLPVKQWREFEETPSLLRQHKTLSPWMPFFISLNTFGLKMTA